MTTGATVSLLFPGHAGRPVIVRMRFYGLEFRRELVKDQYVALTSGKADRTACLTTRASA